MRKNLNRRKLSIFTTKNYLYLLALSTLTVVALIFYFKKNLFYNNFIYSVEKISKKFEYQFKNLNVVGLNNVKYAFLENKIKKYIDSSIFLLPLDKISHEIKQNTWVKNIKLSTNFKNTLFVQLEEYKPLGIYSFNNKKFYFDRNGKIIDQVDTASIADKFIIFIGQSSNIKAHLIMDIIKDINFQKQFSIKRIDYIENRRWNIILNDNLILMLSEESPKKSLTNFIKIEKNLNKADFNNIKRIDLRNINKSLITYN